MSTPSPWDDQGLRDLMTEDGEIVVDRIDHWARTTPDKVFFHYGEQDLSLTYAEFGQRTDDIAGNLHRLGIAKGDRVSVFSTNSLLCALVMFASWKIGAVYAPVNFSFTGRLLAYQIDDTAARLLVTDAALLPVVDAVAGDLRHRPEIVVYQPDPDAGPAAVSTRFDSTAWAELTAPSERPSVELSFDDPANIVYTSGTTGPAKGVLQPHRWLAGYTHVPRLLLSPDDVIYNDLPLYHVGGAIANVVRGAWQGCEIAVWDKFSPTEFWDRIAERAVTSAILLDVMIPWLMKAPESPDDRANTLNKVHMQPLPTGHARFATRFGVDFVTCGFGQTEAGLPLFLAIEENAAGAGTPSELYRGLSHEDLIARLRAVHVPLLSGAEADARGVMGRPTPFMEVAVLDSRDQPAPIGETGQLAVRPRLPGILFSEYLGKPEATVAAWRNLWFHTGDAAVQLPNGMFAFVDRLGDRIRVRGENLSSFQVEDLMNQHPGVQMTAAFAIASEEGDEDEICAFVVPTEGSTLAVADLEEFAASTMPRFMRPRHLRVVDAIPRTPTNKIEKYKLRAQILAELAAGTRS